MLLEAGMIGKLKLRNRFILSPHGTNLAGELGQVTEVDYKEIQRSVRRMNWRNRDDGS